MSVREYSQAWLHLCRRYWGVFKESWRKRHMHRAGLFNEAEANFLPAVLSLQERPLSPTARYLGRALMIFTLLALVWAIFGKTDIVVNAEGRVVPIGQTKAIGAAETGRVERLWVQEGSEVKIGSPLIELDRSMVQAEERKWQAQYLDASLSLARSLALIHAYEDGHEPVLDPVSNVSPERMQEDRAYLASQYWDVKTRLATLDASIANYRGQLDLAIQSANAYRALLTQRDVSKQAYLDKEQARVSLQGQLAQTLAQRKALMAETLRQAYESASQAQTSASQAIQEIRRAQAHSSMLVLKSPVEGVVQQLQVHAAGAAVAAAQQLMVIVPKKEVIEVLADLAAKDIGFIKVGDQVKLKVSAYDYTKYGTLSGVVSRISPDSIVDEKRGLLYQVVVKPSKTNLLVDGNVHSLKEGMAVQADIQTGSRRIIEYLLSPVMRQATSSMGER